MRGNDVIQNNTMKLFHQFPLLTKKTNLLF